MAACTVPWHRELGNVIAMLCDHDARIAELVEQDLESMCLTVCADALYRHARKNQAGGCWACMCNTVDPDNAVIAFLMDFFKIPSDWVCKPQAVQQKKEEAVPAPRVRRTASLFDM